MDKNLASFVKVYSNWIDSDLCNRAISELENTEWSQHQFYSPITTEYFKQSGENELDIGFNVSGKELNALVMQRFYDGLSRYASDGLGYSAWAGYSAVRYNRYVENRLMAKHFDGITTLFDGERKGAPTLSLLSLLNDDFEGGEFAMWDDEVIELKAGDLMIFPSTFLYPHLVRPVKKGIRYSCVSWAW